MGENREYISSGDERGSINISEEVVAVIAGAAAAEVEGVQGLYAAAGRELAELVSKKHLMRGVKIRAQDGRVTVDIMLLARMGYTVRDVGRAVQKAVAEAVGASAGIEVEAVNVHICGIALKKEK